MSHASNAPSDIRFKFVEPAAGISKISRAYTTENDWEEHREYILALDSKGLKRSGITRELKKTHGFVVTERQLKHRLLKWRGVRPSSESQAAKSARDVRMHPHITQWDSADRRKSPTPVRKAKTKRARRVTASEELGAQEASDIRSPAKRTTPIQFVESQTMEPDDLLPKISKITPMNNNAIGHEDEDDDNEDDEYEYEYEYEDEDEDEDDEDGVDDDDDEYEDWDDDHDARIKHYDADIQDLYDQVLDSFENLLCRDKQLESNSGVTLDHTFLVLELLLRRGLWSLEHQDFSWVGDLDDLWLKQPSCVHGSYCYNCFTDLYRGAVYFRNTFQLKEYLEEMVIVLIYLYKYWRRSYPLQVTTCRALYDVFKYFRKQTLQGLVTTLLVELLPKFHQNLTLSVWNLQGTINILSKSPNPEIKKASNNFLNEYINHQCRNGINICVNNRDKTGLLLLRIQSRGINRIVTCIESQEPGWAKWVPNALISILGVAGFEHFIQTLGNGLARAYEMQSAGFRMGESYAIVMALSRLFRRSEDYRQAILWAQRGIEMLNAHAQSSLMIHYLMTEAAQCMLSRGEVIYATVAFRLTYQSMKRFKSRCLIERWPSWKIKEVWKQYQNCLKSCKGVVHTRDFGKRRIGQLLQEAMMDEYLSDSDADSPKARVEHNLRGTTHKQSPDDPVISFSPDRNVRQRQSGRVVEIDDDIELDDAPPDTSTEILHPQPTALFIPEPVNIGDEGFQEFMSDICNFADPIGWFTTLRDTPSPNITLRRIL
ncbi:hypothetical protein H072_6060 [Dactylellina haptotyla CBS 200.50]|uniref:Clr5 domain-containing protein n=1 Tax=Dactylellina haptotyla (strain CBS 200.50) TaxID=1284197 RepID=S8AAX1_DACHA|nr:hypothetical protein H072_6060 [Dactylellina haptotyla CBS 200.50]